MQQSETDYTVSEPLRAAKAIAKGWYQIRFIEMPRPYIHHVNSKPIKVSDAIWKQWYLEERSRDMVYFKVSSTAAFYQSLVEMFVYSPNEIPGAFSGDRIANMDYLAIYQMGRTMPKDMSEYQHNVRLESQLWDESWNCFQVAEFSSDHLEMIEVLGSYEYIEKDAPYIIHAKIVGVEVESKLQFEHVNAASKLDGYRRTLLYRSVNEPQNLPYVIMIHEFESEPSDLESVRKDMERIEPSKDCAFQLRAYRLLASEGFEGECRKPERLKS